MPVLIPSFLRRDGGFLILSSHFSAAAPSSKTALTVSDVTCSAPSRTASVSIALNGIVSFRSALRNWISSLSRRAVPVALRRLALTSHFASYPTRLRQLSQNEALQVVRLGDAEQHRVIAALHPLFDNGDVNLRVDGRFVDDLR